MQKTLSSALVIATILYLVQTTNAAAAHGREREADGAFSPRDKHHGDGDKHHSKFACHNHNTQIQHPPHP